MCSNFYHLNFDWHLDIDIHNSHLIKAIKAIRSDDGETFEAPYG